MDKQTIIDRLDKKAFYSSELPSIKSNGSSMAQALCPWHNDTKPSLTVNLTTGKFRCFGCNEKGDIFDFYQKKHGVDFKTSLNALAKEAGLTTEAQKRIVKTYDYLDESGKLLFQAVRYEPKDFKQRRPAGKGGWIYNLQGVQLVPFNLPDVVKAKSVIIAEGEKDVETLKGIGLVASCNPLGAGKWKPDYNQYFKGKKVVIIPDADKPGRDHALQVAKNLKGIAESVKVVELPELPEKGDVTDWLAQGGTKEKLTELIKQTPEWEEPKETAELIHLLPTLSEIAALDLKVEYLLEGLIPQDSITILYGKGGRGKSTLMMQIGYCISKGIAFEGLATKKATVVYIDFDNPLNVIADKARNFENADNFHYWHITNTKIKPSRMDKQEWAVFKNLPKGSFLIFDTLKSCQGLDMDRDNTMAFVMGRFRELRDEGFTIVVLHHSNRRDLIKNNTTITDNADHVLALKPLKQRETQAPDEQQEEPEYVRDLFFGCGVEDKSRYPKKDIYLSFDGQIFELIQNPEAENYKMISRIMLELAQDGNLPNQSRIVSEANQQLKLHRNKTLEILSRGEGRYWKSKRVKEQKNQKVYEPVVLLSASIYSQTTKQLPEQYNHLSGQHPSINPIQAIDNTELSSCCKDSLTTEITGKCSYCMLTAGQRALCEVRKPCPVENQSHEDLKGQKDAISSRASDTEHNFKVERN